LGSSRSRCQTSNRLSAERSIAASALQTPCVLKLRKIRQRADDAELGHGVRIGLEHQALRPDASCIAAELAPGDEELLLGNVAVDIGGARLGAAAILDVWTSLCQ
jgi:hypothetical protein